MTRRCPKHHSALLDSALSGTAHGIRLGWIEKSAASISLDCYMFQRGEGGDSFAADLASQREGGEGGSGGGGGGGGQVHRPHPHHPGQP